MTVLCKLYIINITDNIHNLFLLKLADYPHQENLKILF